MTAHPHLLWGVLRGGGQAQRPCNSTRGTRVTRETFINRNTHRPPLHGQIVQFQSSLVLAIPFVYLQYTRGWVAGGAG